MATLLINEFDDEQLRVLNNTERAYDHYVDAAREHLDLGDSYVWKTVSGHDYLYTVVDQKGNGRSLGVRSPKTEALFEQNQTTRQESKDRVETLYETLMRQGRLYRALRLPMIESFAGEILREFDLRGLLGLKLLLVGT